MGAPSLAVNWPAIQQFAETSGAHLQVVADKFGISFETVRKRSQRENWLLPSRIQAKAREIELSRNVPKGPCTLTLAAESLLDRQNGHTETVHRIAKKALDRAEKRPPKVESVSDLEKMVNIQRKNLGMDSESSQISVNVNLWGGSAGMKTQNDALEAAIVSCDTPECPLELDDGTDESEE